MKLIKSWIVSERVGQRTLQRLPHQQPINFRLQTAKIITLSHQLLHNQQTLHIKALTKSIILQTLKVPMELSILAFD